MCVCLHSCRVALLLTSECPALRDSRERLSPSHQVVVICGRNEKLAQSLASKTWPLKVIVKVEFESRSST